MRNYVAFDIKINSVFACNTSSDKADTFNLRKVSKYCNKDIRRVL